jgi:hypothetical protein
MYFIMGLLRIPSGYDSIWVVVYGGDSLSAWSAEEECI